MLRIRVIEPSKWVKADAYDIALSILRSLVVYFYIYGLVILISQGLANVKVEEVVEVLCEVIFFVVTLVVLSKACCE